MTQRLPIPGSDDGTWGTILNGFLEVSHNADGTLSTTAVTTALPNPIPAANLPNPIPTTNLGTGSANSSTFLRGDGTWSTAPNALVSSVEGMTGDVTGLLQSSNNLSDISDAGSTRANLHIPVLTPAAAVAVTNISLASPGPTIDGYSFTSGDLVLLTNQSTASQNGLYTWTGASSTLTRPTEFASGLTVKSRTCTVTNGTQYANTTWVLDTPTAGIIVDSGAQTWTCTVFMGGVAYLDALGADRTGTRYSDAALAAAIANGNTVFILGAGTYKFANNYTTTVPLKFWGAGSQYTTLEPSAQGAFMTEHGTTNPTTLNGAAMVGLTINGTNVPDGASATALSCAMNYGDMNTCYFEDFNIVNYAAGANCAAAWFNNIESATEGSYYRGYIGNCTNGVIFDTNSNKYPLSNVYSSGTAYTTGQVVSYNNYFYSSISGSTGQAPSGSATNNTYWTYVAPCVANSSFDYSHFDLRFGLYVNQNAIVMRNGCRQDGGYMRIRGNFGTNTGNTGVVLTMGTPAASADGYIFPEMSGGELHIAVECDGGSTGHQTINFYSQGNGITAIGSLYFLYMVASNYSGDSGYLQYGIGGFNFTGPVSGDSVLATVSPTTIFKSIGFDPYAMVPSSGTNEEMLVPINVTYGAKLTGVVFNNGETVAGNVVVTLRSAYGTLLAQSNATAQAGTYQNQAVPFTSVYSAKAGLYYLGIIISSSSATILTEWTPGSGSRTAPSMTPQSTYTVPASSVQGEVPALSTY